jgi:hypothetical protein
MFRNFFRRLNVVQPRVLAGFTAATLAMTLPISYNNRQFKLSSCEKSIRTNFDRADLLPGNPKKNTLFLIHDSRVPTQTEFVVDFQYREGY